ncbi:hypothetical protein OG890_39055 [Streptomyces anulatus]|uniref:hypothetical protein n=1 Tax=Streptomyces anulatus TaxID=1892 RepID=UPI0022588ACC|nr:hypothetical protein [Streptomyces anulatus]MCX4489889.1 hypothetical protein [Streptomyces anulatus]
MTISHIPVPAPAVVPYEPWEGQADMLAEAAAAGRRAAAWIHSLPAPPSPTPTWSWLVGDLAVAIEAAMANLDPEDCDRMDEHGLAVDGAGGMGSVTQSMLAAVSCVVADAPWLTTDQQVRLLAVASAVTGAAQVLAQDPGSAILHGLLARMCTILDYAARPDGPARTPVR